MEEAITITGLSKTFKKQQVIRDLQMHIPVGSIYGFIGKNGAGKSTTQKLICGLLQPNGGEIKIFGKPANDMEVHRKMGVLIEDPGTEKGWTTRQNLIMQALQMGIENPQETADRALELVGLTDAAKKKVKECSLGMKQRLGIAEALLGSPSLLVLDEPINGLDPEGIREIRQTLLELNQKGITILISSHILGELSRIATHYGIIRNGSMVKEISAEDLSKECRDYMKVKVERPLEALSCLRKALKLDNAEIVDDEIHLFGYNKGRLVNQCLVENGYIADEISFHQMDLEEYFMRLMGGESNE